MPDERGHCKLLFVVVPVRYLPYINICSLSKFRNMDQTKYMQKVQKKPTDMNSLYITQLRNPKVCISKVKNINSQSKVIQTSQELYGLILVQNIKCAKSRNELRIHYTVKISKSLHFKREKYQLTIKDYTNFPRVI